MYKSEEQNEWTAKAGQNLKLRTWAHKSLVSMHVATEDDVHAGRVEQALHGRLHVVTLALMGKVGVVPAAGRPRWKVRGRLPFERGKFGAIRSMWWSVYSGTVSRYFSRVLLTMCS
jgi:hypothetical protein